MITSEMKTNIGSLLNLFSLCQYSYQEEICNLLWGKKGGTICKLPENATNQTSEPRWLGEAHAFHWLERRASPNLTNPFCTASCQVIQLFILSSQVERLAKSKTKIAHVSAWFGFLQDFPKGCKLNLTWSTCLGSFFLKNLPLLKMPIDKRVTQISIAILAF